uniref:Hydroxylysine kinase n=1 Tax=Anopheles maculatus TaxID=74869 RepID=A0A182SS85_9DIPT
MKIANSLDSGDESFFHAQNEIMLHLNKRGIKCPVPVQNIYAKYHSIETLGESKHVVRLLEYIPGKVFHGVPHPDSLFYQAGQFIARIDSALKVSTNCAIMLTIQFSLQSVTKVVHRRLMTLSWFENAPKPVRSWFECDIDS